MNPYLAVIGASAFAGQCGDAWTTYYGIFVKKCATEGDMKWFTQWLAKSKLRLLVIKPALGLTVGVLTCTVMSHTEWSAMFGAACCLALAITGCQATCHNWKINSAAK